MDADETATCSVTEWEPTRLLELTWDYTGEGRSRLRLTPEGDRTVLRLDHDRLPSPSATGYGAGWQLYLDRLAAELTGNQAPDLVGTFPRLLAAYDEIAD